MIIRNASLSLIVGDAVDVLRKLTIAAQSKGGYVVEARQWKDREQVRATGWQPVATVKAASRALVNVAKATVNLLIWFVLFVLPIGLVCAAIAFLLWSVDRRVRRVRVS